MGEVLQGPWASRGTDTDSSAGSGRRGAGRRSAPSGPETGRGPVSKALDDLDRLAGTAARDRAAEARWAVPGVEEESGAVAPPPAVTDRASRRAQNVAMAALTRHDASEGEIRAKLIAKGLDEADVEAEIDRLKGAGLVDDAAFAARVVDRLRERKGMGDSAIRSSLRGRMVPQAVVDAVLAEQAEEPEDAEVRLQEVADDRARRLLSLPHEVAERRLTAYLMRKGYSGSAVRTAVRSALESGGLR